MTINFGKNVETQKMAVNGWNWGKVSFGGKKEQQKKYDHYNLMKNYFINYSW